MNEKSKDEHDNEEDISRVPLEIEMNSLTTMDQKTHKRPRRRRREKTPLRMEDFYFSEQT